MKIYVMTLLTTLLITGCANTVWVREKTTDGSGKTVYEQVGGIPFFAKKEVYNQTTSYAKTWLVATLTIEKSLLTKKDDKYDSFTLDTQSFEKNIDKIHHSELNKIKKEIINPHEKSEEGVANLIAMFSSIPDLTDFSSIKPEQTGNSIAPTWIVNKNERYYLNAPLPWFGSSNLSHEQNPDGTLSKVTSNPDTKLAEGISSLIPLKEYLTGKYVDPLKGKSDAQTTAALAGEKSLSKLMATAKISKLKADAELVYKISLRIIESGYIYKFDKQFDTFPTNGTPLPFDTITGTYSRENLDSKPNEGADEKKGKAIGLTGTIQFPEDWGK